MSLTCRLCGHKKTACELVITLQSETEKVLFVELIQYFCRIQLDKNPLLSQNVCKTCKASLESFMFFCDQLERHQQNLKLTSSLEIENQIDDKPNKTTDNEQDVDTKSALKEQHPTMDSFTNDEALLVELSDEKIDSPMSTCQTEDSVSLANGYPESAASTSDNSMFFNLRKKLIPETFNCSVVLEVLDLEYQQTDTEDELEADDEVVATNKKPRYSSENEMSQSPAKRMRFNSFFDFKLKNDPHVGEEKTNLISNLIPTATTSPENKNYLKMFESELKLDYNDSKFNLSVPVMAKAFDGSIIDEFAEKFLPWSSIELKCQNRGCDKKNMSPYELMLHKQGTHHQQSELFIKCSLCTVSSTLFSFTSYFEHVTDHHYGHLRYCCLICSKICFNFTALFHHYSTYHPIFECYKICLYDGRLFEDFGSLKSHFALHEKKLSILKNEKVAKEEIHESPKNLSNGIFNGYNCEICGSNFRSLFNFQSHKATHKDLYACNVCDQKSSTIFSLIMHENEHHQDSNSNVES